MNPEEITQKKKEGTVGPIIGTIIVIIILLAGAWYFVSSNLKTSAPKSEIQNQEKKQVQNEPQTPATLKDEINNFDDFENIDVELDQIQAEIEAELGN